MPRDSDTFTQLLQQHRMILFKVANGYTSQQDDREDLAQEIILQLWRSFERYDSAFKFSTWMYRVALNVAISYFRKEKTRQRYFTPLATTMAASIAAPAETVSPALAQLRAFIQQLDGLNKAVMLLYLEGYSYKEIGEALQISPSLVGTKLNRLKNKLKQQIHIIP